MGSDYIHIDRLHFIYDQNKIPAASRKTLSRYLHDTGVILHFVDHPILSKIVILKPEWGTECVYNLIDNPIIKQNDGQFDIVQLRELWNPNKYPQTTHYELLSLLNQFELCLNLVGTSTYLLPELLPTDEPVGLLNSYKVKKEKETQLEIHYQYLPPGLISRLICNMHVYSSSSSRWKFGFLLKGEFFSGRVSVDAFARRLHLSAKGLERYNLIGRLRDEVNRIHESLNLTSFDYKYKIPCICKACNDSNQPYLFDLEPMKRFLAKGITKDRCRESAEEVDIHELISGIPSTREKIDLIHDVVLAVSKLIGHHKSLPTGEDDRNSYISTLLELKGISVKDQSRWGQSGAGKNAGELDIVVIEKGIPTIIFEGLNLTSVDTTKISSHIEKLYGYNPLGLPYQILVSYVSTADFSRFCMDYEKYIDKYSGVKIKLSRSENVSQFYSEGVELRVYKSTWYRNDSLQFIYHILAHMPV